MAKAESKITQLPFFTRGCFWNVKSAGDYAKDCNVGQAFALDYLAYEEARPDGGNILTLIVGDMPRKLTGVEIGFLQLVGFAATDGASKAREIAAYWDQCKKERERELKAKKPAKKRVAG